MFKINSNPTFTRKVTIAVPIDGGHDNQTIDVTYRALPDDEIDRFDMMTREGQKDFLRAVIAKLDDMIDPEGNPVAYSDKVRDQVIGLAYARGPLMKGFTDAMVPALAGN